MDEAERLERIEEEERRWSRLPYLGGINLTGFEDS